jgi:peptide/nickel transport system permease protein
MLRFVFLRLALLIPVLWGALTIVFFLTKLAPGDPTAILLGPNASEAAREALRVKLGLSEPLGVQYLTWLALVARGDLGNSITLREPVVGLLVTRFANTAILGLSSAIIGVGGGLLLGVLSAVRRGSLLDRFVFLTTLFGISMPSFWLSLVMIYALAVEARLFPTGQMHSPGRSDPADLAWHLILPAFTASLATAAIMTRLTRAALLDVLGQDFLIALRAKGLSQIAVYRHALRNALPLVVSMGGLQIGYLLLGSALFVEIVFGWPGLGLLTYDAVLARDLPLITGVVLLSTTVFVILNLAVDLVTAALDPRSLARVVR